jgi:transcription antitermination factor NusG
LRDDEVEILRRGLSGNRSVEPHPYLVVGRRVRVIDGPFEGAEGVLVRRKNSLRVVVSLELIMRSVSIEIDEALIEPVAYRGRRALGLPLVSHATTLSYPAV